MCCVMVLIIGIVPVNVFEVGPVVTSVLVVASCLIIVIVVGC
jgi:hypothetical protein